MVDMTAEDTEGDGDEDSGLEVPVVESDEEEVEEDALQLEFEEPARTLCPPATRASDVSRAPSDGAHSAQVAERPSVRNHRRLSLVSQGKLVTQA